MGHVDSTVSYFMEYSISIYKKPTHTYLVYIAEAINKDAEKPLKMYSLSQSSLFPYTKRGCRCARKEKT